jgi:glycosyltransferase involved in cell wall biosynthesis
MNNPRRLLIVSHVIHYSESGRLFAYGPYAKEIDIWADLFAEIVIAAPLRREKPPGDALPLTRANISVLPQLKTGGDRIFSKAIQLLTIPVHIWRLIQAMRQADAIHVRSPGNLGLLGCLLAPCFRTPRVAKYAGQWNDFEGEPWTWRWQKTLLRSRWWKAPVLVYGKWPNQPEHIVPFFTSVMDAEQMNTARKTAINRSYCSSTRVLFVGRLTPQRNVETLLQAISVCRGQGLELSCRIVGDGEMRPKLEEQTERLNLPASVSFIGALPHEGVMSEYAKADILVLVAESEGWGKAIVEGMAFGLVCIGADRGSVPWILSERRGVIVPPRDTNALADALKWINSNPEKAAAMARRASAWAQSYSLEGLKDAIRKVLESWWNTEPSGRRKLTPAPV